MKLSHMWCWLWNGHHDLATFEGHKWTLRCLYCGRQTPGWVLDDPAPAALSQQDIDKLHSDLLDTELKLHGGG